MILLDKHAVDPKISRSLEDYFSQNGHSNVKVTGLSFEQLIGSIRNVLDDRDYEMSELVADYEEFCSGEEILEDEQFYLRLLGSQYSLDLNLKFSTYYEDAARGYSRHRYIGLYSDKKVRAIGKVTNIITADLLGDDLKIHHVVHAPTQEQRDSVVGIMKEAKQRAKDTWNPMIDHRFIVVDQFFDTEFTKESKGGMWGTRLIDLRTIVNKNRMSRTQDIAADLNGKSFK
jgi:hypothetical protein